MVFSSCPQNPTLFRFYQNPANSKLYLHFRIIPTYFSLQRCEKSLFSSHSKLQTSNSPDSEETHFHRSRIINKGGISIYHNEGNLINVGFLKNPLDVIHVSSMEPIAGEYAENNPFSCNSMLHTSNSSDSEETQFHGSGIVNKGTIFRDPSGGDSIELGFSKNWPSVMDVSSMGTMIREYTEIGLFENAIGCYLEMLNFGFPIHKFSYFPCLIKAFAGLTDLRAAKQIHGHILKIGVGNDIYIVNSLLSMYWKCSAVEDALDMFDTMSERDSVSWSTMISGYNQSMQPKMALKIFIWMQESGVQMNRVAFLSSISSCTACRSLIHGRAIHCCIVKNGLDSDLSLANAIIDMYMKCGDQMNAVHVFKRVSMRSNIVTWNMMISGYVHNGFFAEALVLFREMRVRGMGPDSLTVVGVLESCSHLSHLLVGRQIHSCIIIYGLQNDARVETALLDMYCKSGDIETAMKLFEQSSNRNFVMWGAIIAGCANKFHATKALELFSKFNFEGGIADSKTVVSVLRVCSSLTLRHKGMEIHAFSIKKELDFDVFVGSALTDMYAKCRDIGSAQKVFLRLPIRDVVSWNALITGYTQNDLANDALKAFCNMQTEHLRPNTVTIACILSVCSQLSILVLCKQIHGYLIRNMLESNTLVNNSLIATYARCGDIDSSVCLFRLMGAKNEISWNSMISGLGIHGRMDEVLALFDEMKVEGVIPNHITFTGILSVCSHTGNVDEGWRHFRSMSEDYRILPEIEQYTCMVDLLGRAGHLDQAYDLIKHMPCKPDAFIWGSLLGSCKIHGNKVLAEQVADHIFELDSNIAAYHVLLSNIYEDFGKWDAVDRVRAAMKKMGLRKTPGCSWVVIDSKLHTFLASDRSHSQSSEIYAALEHLTEEIRDDGYTPQLHSVIIGHDEATEQSDFL
eukprot:TRINITY_DN9309_c0_g1_i10.p1 TRINITY_DN9309_c0_g1~~TRINITY_DN9309_c0_g1_i10.p1  ORF type:complete len:913 (-),score=81.88 TRINITY_DN9309_c0_g1_i10:1785-4523(-)